MFVCSVLLAVPLKFFLLLYAGFKSVFVDRINFACHGALVRSDLISFEEDAISGYLHAFIDLYDISNKDKILMYFDWLIVPPNRDSFSLINY